MGRADSRTWKEMYQEAWDIHVMPENKLLKTNEVALKLHSNQELPMPKSRTI